MSGSAGQSNAGPHDESKTASRRGIIEWTNPQNRVHVLQIHYTADPAKRQPEWSESVRRGMPRRGFEREYEIRWDVPEGEPVIPEFEPRVHINSRIAVDPQRRLLRFWDFGFVSPVVLFAQLTDAGQLDVFRELCPFNVPLNQLLPATLAISKDLVSHDRVFDAGDPAATSETDLGTAAEVLRQAGLFLHTTRPGTEISYANLRQRMLGRVYVPGEGQQPLFRVHPRCPMLIEALTGAFHLSEHPPHKPVKTHPAKDLVDALRYGNDCISLLNAEYIHEMKKMARIDRVW